MTQDQFTIELLLQFVFGILYIIAYICMAMRCANENPPQRHLYIKFIGCVLAIAAIVFAISGFHFITMIEWPKEPINPDSNGRCFIGYPTTIQNLALAQISGVYETLALSAYCLLFKKSNSKWWEKVGKVLLCVGLYFAYTWVLRLHYDDDIQICSLLFIVFFTIVIVFSNSDKAAVVKPIIVPPIEDGIEVSDYINSDEATQNGKTEEDEKRFMPPVCEDVTPIEEPTLEETNELPTVAEEEIETETSSPQMSEAPTAEALPKEETPMEICFCSNCGTKIVNANAKFCTHCGQQIRI